MRQNNQKGGQKIVQEFDFLLNFLDDLHKSRADDGSDEAGSSGLRSRLSGYF
jgi:hypothetical protein